MKLFYAFPEPLPLERARGVQVAHTAAELARQGIAVELVHVPGRSRDPLGYYGIKTPHGLKLTPLSRSFPWPLSRLHSNRLFFWRFERLLGQSPDAIVLVRHLKLAAMLLGGRAQRRLVYEAHEVFSDTAQPAKRIRQFAMESLVMRRAALVIANSAATANRLRELYGERPIEVLPNGVDWPEVPPHKDWANSVKHVLYAGSFFGWKGVSDLIRAGNELPGFRITLLGGTPEQIAREKEAISPGGARIDFRGHVPHADVAAALAQACIAVLPNRDDPDSRFTSPIKLFEYMAAGCAVVASDLPSLREVLEPDEAVWVRPGDPEDLAAGLRQLADDPVRARRMGERAREKARGFTWTARAETLIRLLRSLEH